MRPECGAGTCSGRGESSDDDTIEHRVLRKGQLRTTPPRPPPHLTRHRASEIGKIVRDVIRVKGFKRGQLRVRKRRFLNGFVSPEAPIHSRQCRSVSIHISFDNSIHLHTCLTTLHAGVTGQQCAVRATEYSDRPAHIHSCMSWRISVPVHVPCSAMHHLTRFVSTAHPDRAKVPARMVYYWVYMAMNSS